MTGILLTVVINTCHSGGIQRPETALAGSYPGMGGLPKYDLIAACSPYQSAVLGNDNEIGGTDRYGSRLTYYMLKALTDNPRCTLEMIRRRAFAAGRLTGNGELPMVWKNGTTNLSFFDKISNRLLPSIAAMWTGVNTVQLAAGKAHGMLPDSVYILYPWHSVVNMTPADGGNPISPPDSLVALADRTRVRVTIATISALTSTAVIESGENRDDIVRTTWACQAVLDTPGTQILPSLSSLSQLYMAGLITPADMDMAAKWAEYHRVLNLTNITPETCLPDIFSFGVLQNGTTYRITHYNMLISTFHDCRSPKRCL